VRCPVCDNGILEFSGQRKYLAEYLNRTNPRQPEQIRISIVEYMDCPTCGSELASKTNHIYNWEGKQE